MEGLNLLKARFPFPEPTKKLKRNFVNGCPKGWCHTDNTNHFRELLRKEKPVIIDGGSYMGLSAYWWLTIYPDSTVICIDHWKGSAEHQQEAYREEIANLYDSFQANLAEYKNRVIPIQMDSITGMQVVEKIGVKPDVVWIDWSHDMKSVIADVGMAIQNFPDAIICGDDWTWTEVRKGLAEIEHLFGVKLYTSFSFWRIVK